MLCFLSLLFSTTVSAKALLQARYPLLPSGSIPGYYPTGTGTGISTGTGTGTGVYSTGTAPYTYTPSPTITPSTTVTDFPTTTDIPTTTSTPPPTCTPTSFKIQVELAYDYDNAPPFGGYATLVQGDPTIDNGAQILSYTPNLNDAVTFTLNADCTLSAGDLIADLPYMAAYHDLEFQTEATIAAGHFYKTVCSIDEGSKALECGTNTGSYFTNDVLFSCGGDELEFGPTGRPYQDFCYDLNLFVVAV
ncbi:hypothetical protein ACLMJK_005679 [Lecanora helva]